MINDDYTNTALLSFSTWRDFHNNSLEGIVPDSLGELKKIYIYCVSTYLSGSGWYLRWIESPPIMLSGCDWAPRNLNLFNKS